MKQLKNNFDLSDENRSRLTVIGAEFLHIKNILEQKDEISNEVLFEIVERVNHLTEFKSFIIN